MSSVQSSTGQFNLLLTKAQENLWKNANTSLDASLQALEVAQGLDSAEKVGLAHWLIAASQQALILYPEAAEHFEIAEEVFTELGQYDRAVGLKVNRLGLLRNLGRYSEALQLAPAIRAICQSHEISPGYVANLEANIALIHYQIGNFDRAISAFQQVATVWETLDEPIRLAMNSLNMANVMRAIERHDDAEAYTLSARSVFQEHEKWQEVARAELNLGIINFEAERYQVALHNLQSAHTQFSKLGQLNECAIVDLYRAQIYAKLNLWLEVLTEAERAEKILASKKIRLTLAQSKFLRAIAYENLKEYPRAELLLASSRRLFKRIGTEHFVQQVDLQRAKLMLKIGRINTAQRICARLLKL